MGDFVGSDQRPAVGGTCPAAAHTHCTSKEGRHHQPSPLHRLLIVVVSLTSPLALIWEVVVVRSTTTINLRSRGRAGLWETLLGATSGQPPHCTSQRRSPPAARPAASSLDCGCVSHFSSRVELGGSSIPPSTTTINLRSRGVPGLWETLLEATSDLPLVGHAQRPPTHIARPKKVATTSQARCIVS